MVHHIFCIGYGSYDEVMPRIDARLHWGAKDALFAIPILLAVADRLFRNLAMDFEQFMPRGWSFAARGIVGEGGHR